MEGQRRLSALAYPAGVGAGERRSVCGTTAYEDSADVGNRRTARTSAQGPFPGALSRQTVLLRIPRLSAAGGPGATFPRARNRAERSRRASDRGLHDGPGKFGQRTGVPQSEREVLQFVTGGYRSFGSGVPGATAPGRRRLIRSGEKHFADQVGIVVLAPLDDFVALEAQIEVIALAIAPAVGRNRIGFGQHGDMRSLAYHGAKLQLQALREQAFEGRHFFADELPAPDNRRKFLQRRDNFEPEIVRDQIVEDLGVGMIKVFEKPDRASLLLVVVHFHALPQNRPGPRLPS